jgi:hypothetical protein
MTASSAGRRYRQRRARLGRRQIPPLERHRVALRQQRARRRGGFLEVYQDGLIAKEYEGVKVLALFVYPQSFLNTN